MTITKTLQTLSLTDIHPYPNNPRINDDAIKAVVSSIRQTANIDPIEVDENHVILSGHTRYQALTQLGYTETPALIVSGLTEPQKRKYRILANKTQEYASWDLDKLNAELEDLEFTDDFDFFSDIEDDINPDEETPYSQKIGRFLYEPTGERPPLSALTDTSKTNELLQAIKNANVTDEEKAFLTLTASRFTKFNYGDIAEYYAHATPDMQAIMEKLALVIIDYDKAMLNGLISLSQELDTIADVEAEDEE